MKNYIVKEDDTLSKVAWEHQIHVHDILVKNPQLVDAKAYIIPGEKLLLPESSYANKRKEKPGECIKEFSFTDLHMYIKSWNKVKKLPIKTEIIGHSVLGKPIYLLKIGNGKKKVFYSGGWHANEWMTSKFLTEWLQGLIDAAINKEHFFGHHVSDILEDVTLFVVPMVNPDGISLVQQGNYKSHPYYHFIKKTNKGCDTFDHWSANIRGVDLNHQWPARWQNEAEESPQEPWPRHFSGTAPLTEPEVKAIYSLTVKHDFAYVLAFHSQGQMIYWGYRGLEPGASKKMVQRLSWKSSYVPIHTADSDGGYKDWFIQETGKAGFTIEVGVGTNPLPFRAYGEIWSNNVLLAIEGLKL